MLSPLMELPLSFAQLSNEVLIIQLVAIVVFIAIIVGGWFIYKIAEKKYICRECGEQIITHAKITNCPSCGTLLM